jgi:hypothetical protein
MALALLPSGLLAGCRDPTEITLDLRIDAPCVTHSATTSVAVGPSFDALPDAPAAAAPTCGGADGEIGTLVLVPSGDKSAMRD